jgi:hypothetical protein
MPRQSSFCLALLSCISLVKDCYTLSDSSLDQCEVKRYKSMPDINEVLHGSKSKKPIDIKSWTKRRNMRDDTPGRRSVDSDPQNCMDKVKGIPDKSQSRATSTTSAFRRLIELPLWQTSLLSAKYVLNHESDIVTYRERTFPTARFVGWQPFNQFVRTPQ